MSQLLISIMRQSAELAARFALISAAVFLMLVVAAVYHVLTLPMRVVAWLRT